MIVVYKNEMCPTCKLLTERLNEKEICYKIETNEQVIEDLGIEVVPVIQLDDGTILDINESFKWVKGL